MFHNKFFIFFVFTLVIYGISQITALTISYWLLVLTLIFCVGSIKKNIFPPIGLLVLYSIWSILSILTTILFSVNLNYTVFIWGFIYLFLPFYLYKTYKIKVFIYLEKYFFILTCLSLPLYLLNNIFLDEFRLLSPFFKTFTGATWDILPNHWTAFGFYTSAWYDRDLFLLRNCGFMWEPGLFAVVICFSISLNWLFDGIKFDKKILIYFIALLTTFSTAGYLALFIIVLIFILEKSKWYYVLPIIICFIGFSFNFYKSTDFLSGKTDEYVENIDFQYKRKGYQNLIVLNRMGIFLYDLERIKRYPWGFGGYDTVSFEDKMITGVNGISGLMRSWGIFVFSFWMYYLFLFYKRLNFSNLSNYVLVLFYLSFLVLFFSQDLNKNILLYFMLVCPFVFKDIEYERRK